MALLSATAWNFDVKITLVRGYPLKPHIISKAVSN